MKLLLAKSLLRFIQRTPWSCSMAILGVTLGVTSIVSVHLISASVAKQLDGLIPDQLLGYSHFLHRDELRATDYFELRRAWRQGRYPTVARLAPLIDETQQLQGRTVRIIGVDLFVQGYGAELDLDLDLSRSAEADFSWEGVWVDASLQGLSSIHVNGVIDAPAGTLIADIPTAQRLLGWSAERLSYVGIALQDPWFELFDVLESLLPGFSAGLPKQADPLRLESWQVVSLAEQNPANQFGKSVLFNISALGLLALLVAWFLIYQVALTWLRRLWPVYERLHVVGFAWRRLQFSFVAGLTSLGLCAGVIGLLVGQSLAEWLYQAATNVVDAQLPLDMWVSAKAMGSAFLVCVVGGWRGFRQAEADNEASRGSAWVVLILLGVAVLGVLDLPTGLLGGFASIAALSLAGMWLIAPLLTKLKTRSHWLRGPLLVRLSAREAVWYPRDVGVAMAGLILAIATAVGVGLMVDSFRADFSKMLDQRLSYDLAIEGSPDTLLAAQQALAQNSDVVRLQSYRQYPRRINGLPMEIVVAHLDGQEMARYGGAEALGAKAVLLSEQAARALQLSPREMLVVDGGEYPVHSIFSSFGDLTPRIIVDLKHPLARPDLALESLSVTVNQFDTVLNVLQTDFAELDVRRQSEIRRIALLTFDQTFSITGILIFLAMMVASIGVYIAITALRLNKRSHNKLMSSMGISRLETIGMDFALGMGLGSVAVMVAVPLGICFGWILCAVINPRAFGWTVDMQMSYSAILTPVVWGLTAAALAAIVRVGRSEGGVGSDGR